MSYITLGFNGDLVKSDKHFLKIFINNEEYILNLGKDVQIKDPDPYTQKFLLNVKLFYKKNSKKNKLKLIYDYQKVFERELNSKKKIKIDNEIDIKFGKLKHEYIQINTKLKIPKYNPLLNYSPIYSIKYNNRIGPEDLSQMFINYNILNIEKAKKKKKTDIGLLKIVNIVSHYDEWLTTGNEIVRGVIYIVYYQTEKYNL